MTFDRLLEFHYSLIVPLLSYPDNFIEILSNILRNVDDRHTLVKTYRDVILIINNLIG